MAQQKKRNYVAAELNAEQLQKLKQLEKEMDTVLIAYEQVDENIMQREQTQ